MKNKKLEFEKLKTKLKSLFFKKLLSVIPNSVDVNLTEEKIETESDSVKSDNTPKIEKQLKTVFIKNSPSSKLNLTNIEKINPDKTNLKFLPIKDNKVNVNKLFKTTNINKSNNIINKNIILNEKVLNKENKIIKNQNNYLFEDNTKKLNKSFNFYKNVKMKYVEKPDQIKNLNFNNVENQNFEIDLKKITIPSKEQLKNIQNKLKLTPTKSKLASNAKKLQKSNIIESKKLYKNNINNKFFNINYLSNGIKTFEKQKVIYALPAFEDGTDGQPVKNDMIAKIHEKEIILNKTESKNYTENRFIKNDNTKNLSENNITNINNMSDNTTQQENKLNSLLGVAMDPSNPLSSNFDQNKNLKEAEKISEMSANTNAPFDKSKLYIKSIEQPLFIVNQGIKQKSPIWRTSVG